MKQFTRIMGLAVLVVFLMVGNVFAYNLGTEITISDLNSSGTGWYGEKEDQEVEPGMQANQGWDLEGFFFDGINLSMVGGYDFVNGNNNLYSGDVFIDVNGDADYGDSHGAAGNNIVTNTYGYDYVLDLDFDSKKYNVYKLFEESSEKNIEGSKVLTSKEAANQGSNPWRYESGGTLLAENLSFGYSETTSGYAYENDNGEAYSLTNYFTGANHNIVSGLDLSFLGSTEFTAHFTMQCGNDNLVGAGQTAPVPEPATMLLLGSGLFGIAGIQRKKFGKTKKNS